MLQLPSSPALTLPSPPADPAAVCHVADTRIKEGHGDLCFAPHDPIFYAGVLGRGWKETFDRSEPPTLLVTVGVNRYSHFFSFLIKNGPKTLHGRP